MYIATHVICILGIRGVHSKMPCATAMYSILVGIKNTSKRGIRVTSEPVCLLHRGQLGKPALCPLCVPLPSYPDTVSLCRLQSGALSMNSFWHAIIMGGTLPCASTVCETARAMSVMEIHTYIHTYIHTNAIRQRSRIRCLTLRCSAIIIIMYVTLK